LFVCGVFLKDRCVGLFDKGVPPVVIEDDRVFKNGGRVLLIGAFFAKRAEAGLDRFIKV